MTEKDYKTWVKHHSTLFMMTGTTDVGLFRAWKVLAMPYDVQDFIEGSNWLATEKPAAFRTSHLAFICQRIKARRAEAARIKREEEKRKSFETAKKEAVGDKIKLQEIFKTS